jgi:hypothetical protein
LDVEWAPEHPRERAGVRLKDVAVSGWHSPAVPRGANAAQITRGPPPGFPSCGLDGPDWAYGCPLKHSIERARQRVVTAAS